MKERDWGTVAVNGVGTNNAPTRDRGREAKAKDKPMRDDKPGVVGRGRMTKLKSNANC